MGPWHTAVLSLKLDANMHVLIQCANSAKLRQSHEKRQIDQRRHPTWQKPEYTASLVLLLHHIIHSSRSTPIPSQLENPSVHISYRSTRRDVLRIPRLDPWTQVQLLPLRRPGRMGRLVRPLSPFYVPLSV